MKTKIMIVLFVFMCLLSLSSCGQEISELESKAATGSTTAPAEIKDPPEFDYPIVDTGQKFCYEDSASIVCPTVSDAFFGQDAQYNGAQPSYTDNGNGTITDNVTGLMWAKDAGDKMTFDEAVTGAENFNLASYDDWRLPTIKELYSLILFTGVDPSGWNGTDTSRLVPFIDGIFDFEYGDPSTGERIIDSQFATSTKYVSTTMGGKDTDFGVNFADGRIKGYPTGPMPGQTNGKLFFVLYVRGNPSYGINEFDDNDDGTISDKATGLIWMQDDSKSGMTWENALNYCENLDLASFDDWRLPNVKELQSIVDYSLSPDTTGSAAIDPIFNVSTITNEKNALDYPFYWSSTTHTNMRSGESASYVSFGRAMGYMNGEWLDVHGAGAQRSDPKAGDPANWPTGHGPQGDAIRIYNYVRCVRGVGSEIIFTGGDVDLFSDAGSMPSEPDIGETLGSPPQEAVDACSESKENDPCEFIAPTGKITGTCLQIMDQIACVPEGGPPGGSD